MISDQSYVHLQTLLRLFSKLEFYKKDTSPIKEELKEIISLKVKDIMDRTPVTIHPNDSVDSAVTLLAQPKNNPLPVVDKNNRLVGMLAVSDLTKLYGVATKHFLSEKNVDKQIDRFVDKFEKEFLVVSRFRVSTWFLASLLFAVVGFAIAMFLILRIA
jgi:Mg/Co/Ni transporter MgtE